MGSATRIHGYFGYRFRREYLYGEFISTCLGTQNAAGPSHAVEANGKRWRIRDGRALSLQRALADPTQLRPADVLYLQRTIGNRATGQLLQAKLTLGPAGDKYEQEADRTAKQVMGSLAAPSTGGATGRDRR